MLSLAIARPQQYLYFFLRRPSRRIADLPARAPHFLLSLLKAGKTPAVHVEPWIRRKGAQEARQARQTSVLGRAWRGPVYRRCLPHCRYDPGRGLRVGACPPGTTRQPSTASSTPDSVSTWPRAWSTRARSIPPPACPRRGCRHTAPTRRHRPSADPAHADVVYGVAADGSACFSRCPLVYPPEFKGIAPAPRAVRRRIRATGRRRGRCRQSIREPTAQLLAGAVRPSVVAEGRGRSRASTEATAVGPWSSSAVVDQTS